MGASPDESEFGATMRMRATWLVPVVAIAMLAVAACSGDGDGSESTGPPIGRILFTSERDGNREVYMINGDGSDETNFTNNPASDTEPSWSPDGTRIALSSDRDGPGQDVYTMNLDGGDVLRLTDSPAVDGGVQWSPDGKRIVFYGFEAPAVGYLWITGAEGGEAVPLLKSIHPPDADENCTGGFPGGWFPDNDRIVFRGTHTASVTGQVCSVRADGSDVKVILSESGVLSFNPALSPDGKRIAFVSNRDGNNEIYIADADGANLRRLTSDDANDDNPTWSPDGQWLAFASDRDGDYEIFIARTNGKDLQQLTHNTANDFDPAWGPAPQTPTATPTATPAATPAATPTE